ncbi:MAG: hypothetical protein H8D22_12020 [Candidatus Cloacimonetes bacterium]|nr:hypothetical protein [Candidatus Cloacimonadota bacterium]
MDWVNKFSETEKLFNEIGVLLKNESFKKSQVVEVFALTALRMCRENAGAIKILLQNGFYCELMMIIRHQIELMFRLNWINSETDSKERIVRTNKIEADAYRAFQAEITNLRSNRSRRFFNEDFIKKAQKIIDDIKSENPQLLADNGNFMRLEKNETMAGDLREKYYPQYRYLCMFTHPNPSLREFHLTANQGKDIFKSFEQSYIYAMKVFKINLNIIINLLGNQLKNMKKIKEIQQIFNEFVGE